MNPKTKPYFYEDCPSCNGTGMPPARDTYVISTVDRRVSFTAVPFCEDCRGEGEIEVAA